MVEPRGRILDDLARLVTDAAGVAQGVRREAETLARAQLDRLISGMDLVSREEFEVVRDIAVLARDENEALEKRMAALEAALAAAGAARGAGVDPLRS
jgi:BMFP domain-containing protein YqiC